MRGASAPAVLRGFPGPRGRPDLKHAPQKTGQTAFRYPVLRIRVKSRSRVSVLDITRPRYTGDPRRYGTRLSSAMCFLNQDEDARRQPQHAEELTKTF